ncbi:AraC family transcriptional regulator [Salipaludibacillus sp. HK11]|uniref:AraC family transcriptional regulator n=1 Tax=Salipaludibacillus sp. HK11 TaxID=3394320 RepID=UPI0039FD77AC
MQEEFNLEEQMLLWYEANMNVLDVRRETIRRGDALCEYRLPASAFIYFFRGKTNVSINERASSTRGTHILHGGKGALLNIVPQSNVVELYLIFYKGIMPATSSLRIKTLFKKHKPFDSPYNVAIDEGALSFFDIVKEMDHVWQSEDSIKKFHVKTLFLQFISCFFKVVQDQKQIQKNKDPVTKAIRYIHDNYAEVISLESLAKSINYSPSHLSLLFKDQTGSSPIDYLIRERLNKAANFLVETDAKVHEIAVKVGYKDAHYFSRLFKKNKGVTPAQYRKENRRQSDDSLGYVRGLSIDPREAKSYIDNDYHYQYNFWGTVDMNTYSNLIRFNFILCMALFISGCSGGANNMQENEDASIDVAENAASEDTSEKVAEHRFGETVIPKDPERIVSLGLEDMTLALDVPLVYATLHGENHYLEAKLHEKGVETDVVGGGQVNNEAVLAADPDLIIISDGPSTDESVYEELTKIAPTILLNRENWREEIVRLGELLNMEDLAEAKVESFHEQLDKAETTITDVVGENATVAFIRLSENMAYLWFPFPEDSYDKGYVGLIYDSLGFKPDPFILEMMEENPDEHWGVQLSLEMLPEIKADYIFVTAGASGGTAEDYEESWGQLAEIEELQVWQSIPAVQEGNVYQVSAKNWMLAGPYADESKINDVIQAVTNE